MNDFAKYHWQRSYDWNYQHAPRAADVEVVPVPGSWEICGLPVASPLGIAAGPLLNSGWILYYASLGFDLLTYKTVRSRARSCYPLPNLQPVACDRLDGDKLSLEAIDSMQGSWAVSFGMPSKEPNLWRPDVERARRELPKGKLLSVSVVATPEQDWSLDQVADDYARCARWALDSGADLVEMNFSCPNVSSCDGQLFQNPSLAARVAARVREALGSAPLLVKLGYVGEVALREALVEELSPHVNALVLTNCITATVARGAFPLFDGQKRGIAGAAIRDASARSVASFGQVIAEQSSPLELVGVGGIAQAADVRQYLAAGACSVQLATAAMLDPLVGLRIRRDLAAATAASL